jgi:hypothetical protein
MLGIPVRFVFFSRPVLKPARDVPLIWLADTTPAVALAGARLPPLATVIVAVLFAPVVMVPNATAEPDASDVQVLHVVPDAAEQYLRTPELSK